MGFDTKDMLPGSMVRRFSTASVKAISRAEPDAIEEMDTRRAQLKKSKSWANGLAAPPVVPKLAIPVRPKSGSSRKVEPSQDAAVSNDDPASDSPPQTQERPSKKSMLPSWMRHLIDTASEIMRPAAEEYSRAKRHGLDRAEVDGLRQSGMQARRNSLTPGARFPRSRTVASLDSQDSMTPVRQLDRSIDQKVRRDSYAGTSSRRISSTPAPRIIRSRTVASLATLDSQELKSLHKDARRVRRNRGGSDR